MHLRIVTSLAALVAAAFALAAEAAAETKVTARLDWAAYGLHAPFFVGLEKGWFKEKGSPSPSRTVTARPRPSRSSAPARSRSATPTSRR